MIVSVVIPIYNQENSINACLDSLRAQSFRFDKIEVILVNDGSSDKSASICCQYVADYENVKYLYEENKGVSAARNLGIKNATGKYIFFLDVDDILEQGTIKKVTRFFNRVYNEVDLVTYPIETVYRGEVLPQHFRYKYLKKSSIYDLRKEAFIGQTTMNIVVKNKFEDNVFFDENQTFSEDQKYCCDVLSDNLKMGYCSKGKYIYNRSENSASGKLAGSCFVFEQCLSFFEELFLKYDSVPLAFQGLFVNDIYWKILCNMFFPYHYDDEMYDNAIARVKVLLKKCDPYVILSHPNFDFFEKFYLMRLKDENSITPVIENNEFNLYSGNVLVCRENSLEMVVTKLTVIDGEIRVDGFLKSVFFQFSGDDIKLFVKENDNNEMEVELFPSSHNYYLSHEQTQNFFAMKYRKPATDISTLKFRVEINGNSFPVHYYFMPLVPFSHNFGIYSYKKENVLITIENDNTITFELEDMLKGNVWLYYDCKGVPSDNGKLQFLHDINKDDGVSRYYVVTDLRQEFGLPKDKTVQFGDNHHKLLLKSADKIITSFIEENNLYPYDMSELEKVSNNFHFDIVYLQHGVLHIVMPWKYSPERVVADKVVVSTKNEKQLFLKSGFCESDLWETRMPRFETKSRNRKRKILFAPSWRSYLVGNNFDGNWEPLDDKFVKSSYYNGIFDFLSSEKLYKALQENGIVLEVKLHPIFEQYRKYFPEDNALVSFVLSCDPSDYELMITDFSSFLYDFLYREIPIVSFIPDVTEFKCGMNGYRELNYDENFWSNVSTTSEEVIEVLMNFFFGKNVNQIFDTFFECDDPKEEIYKKLIS